MNITEAQAWVLLILAAWTGLSITFALPFLSDFKDEIYYVRNKREIDLGHILVLIFHIPFLIFVGIIKLISLTSLVKFRW